METAYSIILSLFFKILNAVIIMIISGVTRPFSRTLQCCPHQMHSGSFVKTAFRRETSLDWHTIRQMIPRKCCQIQFKWMEREVEHQAPWAFQACSHCCWYSSFLWMSWHQGKWVDMVRLGRFFSYAEMCGGVLVEHNAMGVSFNIFDALSE